MPKCLECGFESSRLQWTHFRYRCTGRFRNGKEYRAAYPNAELVDEDLKKRTAVTERNLISKYGRKEGRARWKEYKEKQAYSNSFEYKKKKHGWTESQFRDYNKSRAVTLENLIARHGDERGLRIWEEYCERQAYTNSLEYFTKTYGNVYGKKKHDDFARRRNTFSVESVMEVNNCSKEDAINIISDRFTKGAKFYSVLEIKLVDEIESLLRESIQYSAKSKQYSVWGNDKINFYDIVHNNKAIEFHGDYWHCNPEKYAADYYHSPTGRTAEEIWELDKEKISLLENKRNIPVLVIWESELRDNFNEIVERCVQWIQTGNE